MNLRLTTKYLAAAAAMLSIGASMTFAQLRPTSAKRIPISKESPGEVLPVRVDTVTIYKTDTLTVAKTRVDTVTGPTIYRTDTVTIMPPAQPIHLPFGLYFGLGAGVTAPNGAIFNPNAAGPSGQAQLGWQSRWLGLRADANYARLGEDASMAAFHPEPKIWNFSTDAKLNLPFFNHTFGSSQLFNLYGIGGYTHSMYKDLPMRLDGFNADGSIIVATGDKTQWTHNNGWNAGGGASLSWSNKELFLESRVLAFTTGGAPQSRQMPFVFGINLY
jgi:hypothetical protein